MKTFVVLVLTVVALYVWQHGNTPAGTSASLASQQISATPTPLERSGQNWVKNSLDRTHETIEQVRRLRQESDRP